MSEPQQELTRSMNVSYTEPPLPRASLVIWIVGIGLICLFVCLGMVFSVRRSVNRYRQSDSII